METILGTLRNYVFNRKALRELAALIIIVSMTYLVYQLTFISPDANLLSSLLPELLVKTIMHLTLSIQAASCLFAFSYASMRSLLAALVLLGLSVALSSLGFAYEAKLSIGLALISILLFSARTLDHYFENELSAKDQALTDEPERT